MKKLTEIFKGSAKSKFLSLPIKKQDESKTVSFHVNKEKGVIICRLYDRWYDTYHIGKARCLNDDKFNEKYGRSIAFNRARQKELEYNLKRIKEDRAYINRVICRLNNDLAALDKQEDLDLIYLAGVQEELAELLK